MTFAEATELTRLVDLDDGWNEPRSGLRLQKLSALASGLKRSWATAPRTLAVRSLPLTTLLYPTKYAFSGAALSPAPYVLLTHRALLVQFLQRGVPKTLLFNPTDVVGALATPFFRRMLATYGEYLSLEVLTQRFDPLETQLAALGLGPHDIDYVAFDHFHTQDLRTLLGTTDGLYLSRFPRAKLLAPAVEWASWDALHPLQKAWFVADGREGVNTERVVLTAGDLCLGDGVWLLRTPGHTVGNQTLFVKTDTGIWGTSENGTSTDAWAPLDSSIPGLAAMARGQDLDVVLNNNTPEGGGDQYASMVLEKTLVDRMHHAPAFPQMLASSEVTPSLLAPLVRPRMVVGALTSGQVTVTSTSTSTPTATSDLPRSNATTRGGDVTPSSASG
jgi:hypothetical protein